MDPLPHLQKWEDPLPKSEAFKQLEELFESRIAYIDGAMGTSIQQYRCASFCDLRLQGRHGSAVICSVVVWRGLCYA